ncbi:sn-glycerol-3-phosphate ABC transporter ATP-binding protein UgpC [Rhodococcus sp. BP-252]|uniref:Trehalose import ATP-binding protein SugC n=1 Tax=Rhodococcoides kyotonense TaxID=398843 RepID=A0A177YD89_9NOCA|nr:MULTISPECIES: sn-glycerol-3-phosphate ABC transporter ATP-binding protein UgpC [Rhodococcus]MBY6413018.1 sn-glycerol-3-phosphate ABC transporter ATP-binding protein UgpC [Rhodococcus sp. BP-320]MBY6418543.1 sn-glycerol-3-phosphate ABC transporter ATP-binding protein UgpC [Rhodococcus sp. BP-321]MBY6422755.1 sn-glycerol-3-phosphate ABC transporter ATP-binding protein UgpC [Rhodococcus sp. BP-324]MBY6428491.1 sn-glycerol-3-phosphate ABC transporter ATP-binding protein UgpC [Rhodococcus sp. BP-
MAGVHYAGVSHRYPGADTLAVDTLELDIADGEFIVLVGPSGCGKSTSLRMLAGLESVESGHIDIGGVDVTSLAPRERDVAMVFQNYALYPNMTVADNMGFALRNAGMSKSDTAARVLEAAKMLELEPLLNRKPGKLSGGQRQRVAMGRAIVRQPKVFCMDEPLSNLDAKLRVSTRAQIAGLQKRLGTTTVYVTHDQVEAMTMGDRVAVLKAGVLQQIASPRDLYDSPVNTFVAGFIGSPGMNLIDAPVVDGAAVVGDVRIPVPRTAEARVTVGVRPESWNLVGEGVGAVTATVELIEELGAESFVYGAPPLGADWNTQSGRVAVRVDRKLSIGLAQTVRLVPKLDEVFFFSSTTGQRL